MYIRDSQTFRNKVFSRFIICKWTAGKVLIISNGIIKRRIPHTHTVHGKINAHQVWRSMSDMLNQRTYVVSVQRGKEIYRVSGSFKTARTGTWGPELLGALAKKSLKSLDGMQSWRSLFHGLQLTPAFIKGITEVAAAITKKYWPLFFTVNTVVMWLAQWSSSVAVLI